MTALVLHLGLEAVDLVHVGRFVVATQEEHAVGVQDLECEQCHDVFEAERTAVDKVAIEQVRIRRRRHSVELEDAQQVVELPVGVAATAR